MKKLFFIFLLFLTSNIYSQIVLKQDILGVWESNGVEMGFFKENNKISVYKKSTVCGTYLEILDFYFNKDSFFIETYFEKNDWRATGEYILVDKNTLKVNIKSNSSEVVIYKRKQ